MILGGKLSAAVIAIFADTTARFERTPILGAETQVEELACCGVTATAVRVR